MSLYNEAIYLTLDECRHGCLYLILSRNLSLGVYDRETKGFFGIRTKFGDRFIFEEYHWDTGEPFGTVKPIKELELYDSNFSSDCGRFVLCDDGILFKYLDQKLLEYKDSIKELNDRHYG